MALQFGKVTGRFVSVVADTIEDSDAEPDIVPLQGSVTFTLKAPALLVTDATPFPMTALPAPITAQLDKEGYMSLNGQRSITLLATDSNANPTDVTYEVSFRLSRGSISVSYPSFNISVPANATTNLTRVAPVPASSGQSTTRGVGVEKIRLEGGDFVFEMTDGSLNRVAVPMSGGGTGGAIDGGAYVASNDPRLPVTTGDYAHAFGDAAGRVALGVRNDGTVEIEGARVGIPNTPTKRSPLSLSLSDGTITDTRSALHVRYPFSPTVDAVIRSIHIQNIKDRGGQKYTGALSVNGVWIGSHSTGATGRSGKFASAPTQVSGAFTTPSDGGEYVVRDLNIPISGNGEYLLSLGYTCVAGQVNAKNVGTMWTTATPGDASALAPTSLVKEQAAMFEVWIEIEHSAPVGAYLGDSIWCGAANTDPVYTAPGVLHARANGIVPMLYCHSGSTMSSWSGGATLPKYAKWANLAKPDYVVWELGRNDLINAGSVETMRTRFETLYPYVVSQISPTIYMTTVTPKSDDETSADGIVRRAWNDVLRKEYAGNQVRMVFDAARAVERPGGTNLDPEVSVDGLHVSTQGSMRLAQAINQPLTGRA